MNDQSAMEMRRTAVEDLVGLRRPLSQTIATLQRYEWDCEVELVQLTRDAAATVLKEYLAGRLDERECSVWAEAMEGRDDVGFESGYEELLKQFLFELSTPELFEPMSESFARAWRQRLEAG